MKVFAIATVCILAAILAVDAAPAPFHRNDVDQKSCNKDFGICVVDAGGACNTSKPAKEPETEEPEFGICQVGAEGSACGGPKKTIPGARRGDKAPLPLPLPPQDNDRAVGICVIGAPGPCNGRSSLM